MSILSAQSIRKLKLVSPLVERTIHPNGMSYGLGPASYDVRIAQDLVLCRFGFKLASTLEKFYMPDVVEGEIKDKSSYARRGMSVFNTFIDPGWCGYLTLEIVNFGPETIRLKEGDPICQVVFSWLDEPAEDPYDGKYMDQPNNPVEWIKE